MGEHLGLWGLSHVSQKKRDMGHPSSTIPAMKKSRTVLLERPSDAGHLLNNLHTRRTFSPGRFPEMPLQSST